VTERVEQRLLLDLMGDPANRRILDAGCGDGTFALALSDRRASVVGLDISSTMLVAARRRAQERSAHLELVRGDLSRLPFRDGTFDVVVSVTVLCFVPDAARAFAEMARVLRPGGWLVLGELGRWSTWAALRRLKAWLGSATWSDATFRTPGELRELAQGAGLLKTEVRGAVYYPPVGVVARACKQLDPWRARLTTVGAAFLALAATKP